MSADRADVRELWPLLWVQDIHASVRFYTDTLGFAIVGKAESDKGLYWCRISRGGASLMLQEREAGADDAPRCEVGFYFVCDDADLLFDEFTRKGVELHPPVIESYGMKQLFVPEPDGYTICFESPC